MRDRPPLQTDQGGRASALAGEKRVRGKHDILLDDRFMQPIGINSESRHLHIAERLLGWQRSLDLPAFVEERVKARAGLVSIVSTDTCTCTYIRDHPGVAGGRGVGGVLVARPARCQG
jgi:hypothetical protein